MKQLLLYGNCQMDGVGAFLKKTPLVDSFNFLPIQHNWQLVLLEQPRATLYEYLKLADVLVYQPHEPMLCTDGEIVPPSDWLIENYLPEHAITISLAYQYNAGFFPLLKVGEGRGGWITSQQLKNFVQGADLFNPPGNLPAYIGGYGCARRFIECLAEQSRREQTTDIKMVPFILENYRKQRLFLTQNHPTSAMFAELATQVYARIIEEWQSILHDGHTLHGGSHPHMPFPSLPFLREPIPWTDPNEANMNGTLAVHPAVVEELGLEYPTDTDLSQYRVMLEQMVKDFSAASDPPANPS